MVLAQKVGLHNTDRLQAFDVVVLLSVVPHKPFH